MDKSFYSDLSIERFAAFLDGNLQDDEMIATKAMIQENECFTHLLDANLVVDNNISLADDMTMLEEVAFQEDFELPIIEENHTTGDIFQDFGALYNQSSTNNYPIMNNDYDDLSNHSIFGEGSEEVKSPFIKQYYDDTCAIRSQQIIMRDYGVDISEHNLRNIAIENGWYTPDEGTALQDVGKLLNLAGINCHQSMNNTVYDLVGELSQGHRVIVGVDSGELWESTVPGQMGETLEDYLGISGADHALIVAGVDVNPNDPKDMKVVLTDPGSGDLRIEYKMEEFLDAWKDSNCFMVSTEKPAPYQFDPITNSEVPSGFHSNYAYNAFILDNGYQLSPDGMTLPDNLLASGMLDTAATANTNDAEMHHEGLAAHFQNEYNAATFDNDGFIDDNGFFKDDNNFNV